MIGSINGYPISANPDTSSDVKVIRESYAIELELNIVPDNEDTPLELIDGSCVATRGIVHDVAWKYGTALRKRKQQEDEADLAPVQDITGEWVFGRNANPDDTFVCTFYVVESLTFPVILSSNLLYSTNAFTACDRHIVPCSGSYVPWQSNYSEVAVVKRARKSVFRRIFKTEVSTGKDL